MNYEWEMIEKEIDVAKRVDGKIEKTKEMRIFIKLNDKEEISSREWIVEEITKKTLIVYDNRYDGSDTTAQCKLTWEKK